MKTITINENDNVCVLVADAQINGETVPKGHKLALCDIAEGQNIIKYGFPIGHATKDIKKGEHVHVHNIKTNLGDILDYEYKPVSSVNVVKSEKERTFQGYRRKNGSVGIRNEIWIVNTVGCVNKVSERIAALANESLKKRLGDNAPEVFTYVHPFGCSQMGDDQLNTQKILACMVNHPNAAGVLVIGLGCENNNIPVFKNILGSWDDERVKFLVSQECEDEVAESLKLIDGLADYALTFKRETLPISELKIGLKCGGSDGFSGITANPLVGVVCDKLTGVGGTSLLTEVPEMFGAETILMNRCVNEEIFDKTVSLINNFKMYFTRHDQQIYENPSPGNKAGGISTLEDKSLGCTQKGGTSAVVDVYGYGEACQTKGLNLVNAPGNDIVAITALMAAGAHIILFTTGRGTPVGAPVPTVKVATNSDIYKHKSSWFDFNAGVLLEGANFDTVSEEFLDYLCNVASGEKTANEKQGYREISIFKDGVIL